MVHESVRKKVVELKTRLRLKWYKKEIEEIVNWNFGVSPKDNERFDWLILQERETMFFAEACFPQIYKDHIKKYY